MTTINTAVTENFNTLANSGIANTALPVGWDLLETGGSARDNEQYAADNGALGTGDTLSFGTTASTERAFGGLQSGTLIPVIGASFTNNTGVTIGELQVAYTGEMWRAGVATRGTADQIDFQYSTDATSLGTGTWTDHNALDYMSTNTSTTVGAKDGNDSSFRTAVSSTVPGLSIDNGATFWIRWNDFNIGSSDDGLAVDDFSLTPSDADGAPAVTSTTPSDNDTDVAVNADITITFGEHVDVTGAWFTISCATSGSHTAVESGSSPTFTLNPDTDFAPTELCTVTVVEEQVTDQDSDDPPDDMAEDYVFDFTTAGLAPVCGDPYTPIYTIQGSGLTTPIPGNVTTEGIVVGDFEGPTSGGTQGFYIQEPAADSNSDTSEGIFVFTANTNNSLALGDRVRVSGYARERFSMTTINGSNADSAETTDITPCSSGNVLPPATNVTLPFTDANEPENWEGMRVTFTESLVIAEYFAYAQFGEIVLAEPLTGESRPFSGTAIDEPGAAANARTAANLLRRITLDDGLGSQNPSTLRHPNGSPFSLINYFRGGDTVTDATGVLTYEFSRYRIQPTAAATHTAVNPRPSAPSDTAGRITVAAQNTLNYFLTLDESGGPGDNVCGGNENLECRGADADQPNEFTRQRDKLLATLIGLDADVIGLNEIENTPGVEPAGDIVDGMNAVLGAGTYAYIDTGVVGTDAIRVGMIYRTANVHPVGDHAILDSTVDPRFIDTKSRPVLAQTFQEIETGAMFTVAVNHLKSKGSACTDVSDPDAGDGQGNCNGTRTLAAQALVDWLASDPTDSGDEDFLIIGDLNAYAKEDPIDAIKNGSDDAPGGGDDYTNLVDQFLGTYAYSYVFDGQFGYLDHAMSSSTLTGQVTGIAEWHINADEAGVLDYDTTFKPAGQEALYEAEAYRSSDHDGVIVGLDLVPDCAEAPFTDVAVDSPYCADINWLKTNGITNGYPDGSFMPTANLTRQAAAAFLSRLVDADPAPCTSAPFSDIGIAHPFCPEITWMKDSGITNGYPGGTFLPGGTVTRMAMAAFLARAADADLEACTSAPYTDIGTSHPFCPEITWLKESGIDTGFEDGTFRPSDPVTRQVMAALLAHTAAVLPDQIF